MRAACPMDKLEFKFFSNPVTCMITCLVVGFLEHMKVTPEIMEVAGKY